MLSEEGHLKDLSQVLYRKLLVIKELYRQQAEMYRNKIHRISDRIVSISQPHIRLSGPALGRPKKRTAANTAALAAQKKLVRQDEIDRIAIEGKFAQGKRRFGLSKIMAKLAATSESMIMLSFIVMNLEKILTNALYFCFFTHSKLLSLIIKMASELLGQRNPLVRLRPA